MKSQIKLRRLALGVILFVSLVVCAAAYKKENDVIVKINGEPVERQEFMLFLSQQRSKVLGYFKEKYGIDDYPAFWSTSYSGETPIKMANKLALDELKTIKIQQLLAKENHLVDDVSYRSFLSQLNKENERRKKAVQNKQVIYGPIQYEEWGTITICSAIL